MRRDLSVDLLKFIAVLCVVNSHMDVCYPEEFRALATGGALGDALFFFVSGYTLFLGREDGFIPWYKRRLARVLPAVIICVMAYAIACGKDWYDRVGGYWFVQCILIYYVLLFAIRKYMLQYLWVPFFALSFVIIGWWFFLENPQHSIYGGGYFMWCHYFMPMLLGSVVGLKKKFLKIQTPFDCLWLLLSLSAFFISWKTAMRNVDFAWLQLVSIPLLSVTMFYLYKVANAAWCMRITKSCAGKGIMGVGGLCLEIYLTHRVFLTDRFNAYFPANVLIAFVGIILLAYIVRCVSRFMVQTLNRDAAYNIGEIFKFI